MPKPICVKCQLFFKPKKNGVYFEEGMPSGKDIAGEPIWEPYKLWACDLWECRGCGNQIIFGFGQNPVAEHYQPEYAEKILTHPPMLRVNDC